MPASPFYVQVGINPSEYNQRNPLYIKKSIDKQPAGLNFYEQNWNIQQQGTVHVEHGQHSFTIPFVLGSTGTENADSPKRGIYKFSIRSGITAEEFINHDEARLRFTETLQNFVRLGWQPYIEYYSDPRLSGQQSIAYAIEDEFYAPDPLYIPTLDEWMQLGSSHGWVFHTDGVFMEMSFRRKRQFMDKNGQGVYLLNYKLLTREAHARNHFSGDEREQWQDLWIEKVKEYKMLRYQKEVELIKQGYHINTQYVEPQIHPDDPVEPEDAKALLDYIQQNNPQPYKP
ncbi:hypothetical protein [Aliikangiella sp. IMCC44359]|uniref:hypothetical protein n=1 Tax=Aliikangiella sp. IMCC44359 TaxID=3459125 RepID=UPI00403A7D0D